MNEKQWFIFFEDKVLLHKDAEGLLTIPRGESAPLMLDGKQSAHHVFINDGREVYALSLTEAIEPDDEWEMRALRSTYYCLPTGDYLAAGKAYEIIWWDKHSQYCPVCGSAMEQHTPIMKKCPKCGYEMFPQVSTAIIVLIMRGNEALLVHNKYWKTQFHGLVAGFLEAGETLEECVRREVKEEVGLHIKNIRYFKSQPWPYPSGLMVGFTAEYESGEIKLQEEELNHADWFSIDNLPLLPQKLSIARQLIDWWISRQEKKRQNQNEQT